MEALELNQPANSIELARTKDGHYSYHIKCRGDEEEKVLGRILWWEKRLNEFFPVKEQDASSKPSPDES